MALAAGVVLSTPGCRRDPPFSLAASTETASVRLVQSMPGTTLQIGNDADELCVIQSISSFTPAGVGAPSDGDTTVAADEAGAVGEAGATGEAGPPGVVDTLDAQFPASLINLYFDSTGTWYLAASGAAQATVACISWSAFGGARTLWRVDNGGTNGDLGAGSVSTEGQQACVLSDIEGDFTSAGNGAAVAGGSLTVTNTSVSGIFASATCINGAPITTMDIVVDSRSGTNDLPVPPSTDALCGLSALSSLTSSDSSIGVSGNTALGVHSLATVRCLFYGAADAE